MDRNMDLIVIGAGPAGLSAACAARACRLDVTLVDEQAALGGQLFRNIETPMAQALLDPKERAAGLELVKPLPANPARPTTPAPPSGGLEPHRVSCTMNGKAEELAPRTSSWPPAAWNSPSLPRLDAARRHGRGRGRHPAALRRHALRRQERPGRPLRATEAPAPPACRAPA